MALTVIVTRSIDRHGRPSALTIERVEWEQLVANDNDLRRRTEPHVAINPTTGERIVIEHGELEAEFGANDRWMSFLRFRAGDLVMRYSPAFDDPSNPVRKKIVAVARVLAAIIKIDQQVVDW